MAEFDRQGNIVRDDSSTVLVQRVAHGNAPEPRYFTYHAMTRNGDQLQAANPDALLSDFDKSENPKPKKKSS